MNDLITVAVLSGLVIFLLIGTLLWAFVNAVILLWRVRKLKGWVIRYKDASIVTLKAGFIGLGCGLPAYFAVIFVGSGIPGLEGIIGFLFFLVAWWFAHSSALLKLAGTPTPLTDKDAKAITASVFAYLIGSVLVLNFLVGGGLFFLLGAPGTR